MLNLLSSVFKLFGNKSEKDVRELQPVVENILEVYNSINNLSNDELRAKTPELKKRVSEYLKEEENTIEELKGEIESNPDMEVDEKEKIYDNIDQLKKTITKKTEDNLNEILPEAFAIVKETARRFKENETTEVTATQMDKDLAATDEKVEIKGDKAIYHNSWIAGGAETTWDMVHYDVQLIGGIILHQGKIAEMATGEGKTLAATLPIYLNALSGKGVHIITVNDYLAKRDSEWMGPIFEFHGLRVDCIDKH